VETGHSLANVLGVDETLTTLGETIDGLASDNAPSWSQLDASAVPEMHRNRHREIVDLLNGDMLLLSL
jgi:hypothetical protein